MRRKTIHQAVYQGLVTGEFFQMEGDRCWCHTSSLLMGNSCLWGGLNCGTCWFLHPPGNLSPAIYCYWTSDAQQVTSWENVTYMTSTVDLTFTRRIQGRVETFRWMAIGRSWLGNWRSSFMPLTIHITTTCTSNISFNSALMVYSLKSFLRLHVRRCVQAVIEAMSLSASGCASTLVDLQTGHGGYTGGFIVVQLLTEYLTKSWGIILICIMQSMPK